jgi:hypothetical protein
MSSKLVSRPLLLIQYHRVPIILIVYKKDHDVRPVILLSCEFIINSVIKIQQLILVLPHGKADQNKIGNEQN